MRLLERLTTLPSAIQLGDYRPTDQAEDVYKELSGKIDKVIKRFDALVKDDLIKLNTAIAEAKLGAIIA